LFAKYFPVIAIAEIKFILKTSGQNYKDQMNHIEAQTDEHFIEEQSHHH
jgi:molybdopterin-containing oxidoreductase family membrane subunit